MPIGRWIYEKTNTSGGGGVVVAPDAPPVVPGVGTAREIYNGLFEVDVPWTAGAGASPDNFAGVAVFLEDPDISTLAEAPLNGTASLDGTSQVSGKWQPVRETDSFTSPAVLQVDGQPAARDIRVYLQAYGKVTNATLVRANKTGATPSVKVTIPAAAGSYVSGQEYAWLITNPSVVTVPDFDNPAGPQYYFTFNYTAPDPSIPLPPGLQPFAGVQTVYEYQDGRRAQAVFLAVNKPDTWISDEYSIGATQTYIIYFCSTDAAGNVNQHRAAPDAIHQRHDYLPARRPGDRARCGRAHADEFALRTGTRWHHLGARRRGVDKSHFAALRRDEPLPRRRAAADSNGRAARAAEP